MPVNSTHPDYDGALPDWIRARDVLAGEDAVKAGGEKYLPRLDSQTDEEFLAYRNRATFYNATARSAEGFIGLIFRRPPFIKIPEATSPRPSPPGAERGTNQSLHPTTDFHRDFVRRSSPTGIGRALAAFVNDADMLGTTLAGYAKNVTTEVVGLGRAGSLVDWEGDVEKRAYVSLYAAEQIINWRVERVNGRNIPTLIVLSESVPSETPDDEFEFKAQQQVRVLKLVPGDGSDASGKRPFHYQVEIWRPMEIRNKRTKVQWALAESKVPLRLASRCR